MAEKAKKKKAKQAPIPNEMRELADKIAEEIRYRMSPCYCDEHYHDSNHPADGVEYEILTVLDKFFREKKIYEQIGINR